MAFENLSLNPEVKKLLKDYKQDKTYSEAILELLEYKNEKELLKDNLQ